jgi:hypothetical protein
MLTQQQRHGSVASSYRCIQLKRAIVCPYVWGKYLAIISLFWRDGQQRNQSYRRLYFDKVQPFCGMYVTARQRLQFTVRWADDRLVQRKAVYTICRYLNSVISHVRTVMLGELLKVINGNNLALPQRLYEAVKSHLENSNYQQLCNGP